MLSIASKIPKKIKRGGSLQPVLPLVPEKLPSSEEDKSKFVAFELKTRVNQPDNGTKYKKFVRKFEEGTPQMWIDLVRDLEEIWVQNSMNGGTDRASTVRALVRGESLTAFEAALQDARMNEAGEEQPITPVHVQQALEAVGTTVFPHRALEIQKLWMNRRMFKPSDLTTRKTSAAINRLNNSLPLFPGGSDASKFTETEIVGLLEWSLPPQWRAKFDLDGYIPTLDTKARLIEACEAIERNEAIDDKETSKKGKKGKPEKSKFENSDVAHKKGDNKKAKKFYCTEHGQNGTHNTSSCYTLKNREQRDNKNHGSVGAQTGKIFSNKAFRKEVNLLARASSKKKVLDLYATAIQREQGKLAKQANKRKKANDENESSESEDSVQVIEEPVRKRTAPNKKVIRGLKKRASLKNDASYATTENTLEEEAYQRTVTWLKDHGETNIDEPLTPPPDDPSDS
jgi:hypothetical protein